MNKYELAKIFEDFAPLDTQEQWDCSGWIIDNQNTNVNKVMLCLTPTNQIFEQAELNNCDMIISHHPLFNIDCRIFKDFNPQINLYCSHTNMDKAKGGTTDCLIKTIGLFNQILPTEHEFLRLVRYADSTENLSRLIHSKFPNGRIVNNQNINYINKIAFCAGSGVDFVQDALELGADCLITGDVKFHAALDSQIVLYDIGHFESEIMILETFKKLIDSKIATIFANEKSPFTNLT